MTHRYDDIIDLPYPQTRTRKPMPLEARAAQFAPFAALNGHQEAIDRTAQRKETQFGDDYENNGEYNDLYK